MQINLRHLLFSFFIFGQDQQDLLDNYLIQRFPEESAETQSASDGSI
ncbi:MAG: hypothetical protein V3V51_03925 [Desulfobacterales bacterium]